MVFCSGKGINSMISIDATNGFDDQRLSNRQLRPLMQWLLLGQVFIEYTTSCMGKSATGSWRKKPLQKLSTPIPDGLICL